MSNSWRASLQQIIQKLDYDRAWVFSRVEKLRLRRTIDQGNLIKLLGGMVQQVRPDHEEILLDGNRAIRKGMENHFVIDQGNLIISTLKKWEDSQYFHHGKAIQQNWKLSVESRSFVKSG